MTHKHIISTLVLMSVIFPTASFAETAVSKNTQKNNVKESVIYKDISEKEKDKNRKQRINFALKAIEQNIQIVEKSIKQATLRLDCVDQTSPKVSEVRNNLNDATAKLNDAKKGVEDIRASLKNISTSDIEQVKSIREKIDVVKNDIAESIKLTKKAVTTLRTMKVIKSDGPQVITTKVK